MYCTGGIRCEKGAAYLKSKGVASNVLQLEGGIHKYLEKYPEGHYKGKLYVFDNRKGLAYNNEIVAVCCGCNIKYDVHRKCKSDFCHRFILVCDDCEAKNINNIAHCCNTCHQFHVDGKPREQCECTESRQIC